MNRGASENPLAERLYDFVLILDGGGYKSPERSAILFRDDHVVAYVNETAGKVTCVRSLEGGICKTLARTVGTDEVFEHAHTLLKVGDNRVLDDVGTASSGLLRFCHKSSHTAELLDLLSGSSGS